MKKSLKKKTRTDCHILKKFYNDFNAQLWTLNNLWDLKKPCCEWYTPLTSFFFRFLRSHYFLPILTPISLFLTVFTLMSLISLFVGRSHPNDPISLFFGRSQSNLTFFWLFSLWFPFFCPFSLSSQFFLAVLALISLFFLSFSPQSHFFRPFYFSSFLQSLFRQNS